MTVFSDRIEEEYVTESELAVFLNVEQKRLRDARSHHRHGKERFIDHIKPSGKCVLYKIDDVMAFLKATPIHSFGIGKENPDLSSE